MLSLLCLLGSAAAGQFDNVNYYSLYIESTNQTYNNSTLDYYLPPNPNNESDFQPYYELSIDNGAADTPLFFYNATSNNFVGFYEYRHKTQVMTFKNGLGILSGDYSETATLDNGYVSFNGSTDQFYACYNSSAQVPVSVISGSTADESACTPIKIRAENSGGVTDGTQDNGSTDFQQLSLSLESNDTRFDNALLAPQDIVDGFNVIHGYNLTAKPLVFFPFVYENQTQLVHSSLSDNTSFPLIMRIKEANLGVGKCNNSVVVLENGYLSYNNQTEFVINNATQALTNSDGFQISTPSDNTEDVVYVKVRGSFGRGITPNYNFQEYELEDLNSVSEQCSSYYGSATSYSVSSSKHKGADNSAAKNSAWIGLMALIFNFI